jgi:hypothetical protein
MPSLVTLLIVQCHHVRGRAESGGDLKPSARGSGDWAKAVATRRASSEAERMRFIERKWFTGGNGEHREYLCLRALRFLL